MLNTVLSSRVGRVSAMVSVRFSGMFNMVQEFGTAVYRIAGICGSTAVDLGRFGHPHCHVRLLTRLTTDEVYAPSTKS